MDTVSRGNFGENCPKWRLITSIFGYFLPGTSIHPLRNSLKKKLIKKQKRTWVCKFITDRRCKVYPIPGQLGQNSGFRQRLSPNFAARDSTTLNRLPTQSFSNYGIPFPALFTPHGFYILTASIDLKPGIICQRRAPIPGDPWCICPLSADHKYYYS